MIEQTITVMRDKILISFMSVCFKSCRGRCGAQSAPSARRYSALRLRFWYVPTILDGELLSRRFRVNVVSAGFYFVSVMFYD